MQVALLAAGVIAWIGVGVLAIGLAEWGEDLLGLIILLLAVLVAWAAGEYVTERVWGRRSQ
jgi:membrane protein implicated in regulation of membrane protease activity